MPGERRADVLEAATRRKHEADVAVDSRPQLVQAALRMPRIVMGNCRIILRPEVLQVPPILLSLV